MIWITGGFLVKRNNNNDNNHNNFEKSTFLVETKDISSLRTMKGPDLPKALIYHCMVSINERFTFLHGGKMDAKPSKETVRPYKKNFEIKNPAERYFAYNDFNYWRDTGTSTSSFESSYLFDWKSMKWIQVLKLLKFCDLNPLNPLIFRL